MSAQPPAHLQALLSLSCACRPLRRDAFDAIEALKSMPIEQKVVVGIGAGGLLAFILLLIFI